VKIIKNSLIILVGLGILILLLLWMQGLFTPRRLDPGLNPEKRPPLDSFNLVSARFRTLELTADAVGSIQSRSTTNIASKILASIVSVNVRPGDIVKKGALLITLDDRDLHARQQQAKNALNAAKAAHEKAQLDRQRYQSLLDTKSVTQNAYDDKASAEKITSAKLDQAQEQVREADVMRSYAKINASMSGIVTDKLCDPGDIASPGVPLLTMYDPDNLRLEAAVREQLSGRLTLGQQVQVTVDAIDKTMTGTVEEIVPSADPVSRTVTVKTAIPREEGIFPGMFGRIRIPLDPVKFLVIPKACVRQVGQLELVTVVKDGRPITRAVRTGRTWDDDIEILSGLSEGEEVVLPSSQ